MDLVIFFKDILKFIIRIIAIGLIFYCIYLLLPILTPYFLLTVKILIFCAIVFLLGYYYHYIIDKKFQDNYQKVYRYYQYCIFKIENEVSIKAKEIKSKYLNLRFLGKTLVKDRKVKILQNILFEFLVGTILIVIYIFFNLKLLINQIIKSKLIYDLYRFVKPDVKNYSQNEKEFLEKYKKRNKQKKNQWISDLITIFSIPATIVILFELITIDLNFEKNRLNTDDLKSFLTKQEQVFINLSDSKLYMDSLKLFTSEYKPESESEVKINASELLAWLNRPEVFDSITPNPNFCKLKISNQVIEIDFIYEPRINENPIIPISGLINYLNKTISCRLSVIIEKENNILIVVPSKIQIGMVKFPSELITRWILTKINLETFQLHLVDDITDISIQSNIIKFKKSI